MTKSSRLFAGVAGLTAALLLISSPLAVRAADPPMELTISPVKQRFEVDPGQNASDVITVLNSGQSAYDVLVYATPYSVTDANYNSNFDDASRPRADGFKWVTIPQTTWHLEPRETVKVPYSIVVPKNASPGSHYAAIFVEVQPSGDGSGIVRKHRAGMLTYVAVKGDQHLSGGIESTSIAFFQPTAPMKAAINIKNTGNTDFQADVTYRVTDVFGRQMYNYESTQYILPDTTRDISLEWADSPWFGLYKVYVGAKALDKVETKQSWVLVAPTWLIFILILAALLGVVDVLRRKKRTPARMQRHR